MAYNPYGGGGPPGYGQQPPSFPGYPGMGGGPPGMAPPPGLGPPPGMSSAPGMAPPPGAPGAPGAYQPNATQANRPSGLPSSFQPPPNLPNINFNARIIRLGTSGQAAKPASSASHGGRRDDDGRGPPPSGGGGGRSGMGMDRGGDHGHGRGGAREILVPLTPDEKQRLLFVSKVPEMLSDEDVQKILNTAGRLRRWESSPSALGDSPSGSKFGFAQFDDMESLGIAMDLLKDIQVPAKKQKAVEVTEQKDDFEGIGKITLDVAVDESSQKAVEQYREERDGDGSATTARLDEARPALKKVLRNLFYPPLPPKPDGEGDMAMTDANGTAENVEVVNIPLAQEDELADIPAEYRETVAAEISAFRERSNRRDYERMKQEEEMEAMERLRNGISRAESPPPGGANSIPVGPRSLHAPAGPKGANGARVSFLNGGLSDEDVDTDASDEELHRREERKHTGQDDKLYNEAERKWANRERSRAAALERERERERQEAETLERRRQEQLDRDRAWDDDREASRQSHPFYRDRVVWSRQRARDRGDEQHRDDDDRRAEEEDRRREAAEMKRTRGLADSFLDQQAKEMEQEQQRTATAETVAAAAASASAPQPFKLSLGAAAQRAQAQRAAPQRRTIAEVEGLLDDEETDTTARRQLVPIEFEPMAPVAMSDEEISAALRSLAQEIPSERQGLWDWPVQWDFLDEAVMRDKLRPFVEKKIVEYLGVQEEVIVQVIEDHVRGHGKPGALVDELAEALDDEAEDLVKKLWRMVIFFTECEKRGLPT